MRFHLSWAVSIGIDHKSLAFRRYSHSSETLPLQSVASVKWTRWNGRQCRYAYIYMRRVGGMVCKSLDGAPKWTLSMDIYRCIFVCLCIMLPVHPSRGMRCGGCPEKFKKFIVRPLSGIYCPVWVCRGYRDRPAFPYEQCLLHRANQYSR